MRRKPATCLVAALVASALAAAPTALAQAAPTAPQLYAGVARLNEQLTLAGQGSSGLGLPRRRTLFEFRFKNHDGYTISVLALGQTVALDVSRARFRGRGRDKVRERVLETTYFAHGKVTSRSIEASFGDRGRIAVRFRPSAREVHASRKAGCKRPNHTAIADLGVFDGVLSFQGEGGFTSAEVHHIRGRSVDLAALLACLIGVSPKGAALPHVHPPFGIRVPGLVGERSGGAGEAPAVPTHPSTNPTTTLVADHKEALSRIIFAAQARGEGRPRFLAIAQATEGPIGVVRFAYVRGATPAFSFDDTLADAAVRPPRPFRGAAELRRGSHNAKSWSGSLAVSFLGAPSVPLTGTQFGASLSRGF